MLDNFSNFFNKSSKLPYTLSRPGKETESSRTDRQSQKRITHLDHRKSNKVNFTPFSDNVVLQNSFLQSFVDSKVKIKAISFLQAEELWRQYHRSLNHRSVKDTEDFQEDEPYSKFLGRTKIKLNYQPGRGWFLVNYNIN